MNSNKSSRDWAAAPTFAEYARYGRPTLDVRAAAGPRVSIVTVVRNGAAALGGTIESVRRQTYPNIEYLIVDGASTDGTLDVIRSNAEGIDHWISEPDDGIADAWNKGIAMATGEIIGILNADDQHIPDTVNCAVHALSNGADLAYGSVFMVDHADQVLHRIPGTWKPDRLFLGIGFLHPSVFVLRRLYERTGLFNTKYRMAMDADWIIRAYRDGAVFERHKGLTYMRADGVSNRNWRKAREEYVRVVVNNRQPLLQRSAASLYLQFLVSYRKMRDVVKNPQRGQ